MSSYKLVGLNCGNMDRWPHWNFVATIMLPGGSIAIDYPTVPENAGQMTLTQLRTYVLAEFEKKQIRVS